MSSILDRIKQNGAGSPDVSAWLDFTRRVEREVSEEASKDIANLKTKLAAAEGRAQAAEAEMRAVVAERDAARESIAGYEAKLAAMQEQVDEALAKRKQVVAALELEQRATLELRDRHETSTANLQQQLVAEKDRFNAFVAENASMKAKMKSKTARKATEPTPVPTPTPAPDFSDLVFEIGDIVRGPNGIAGAKVKLARTN